MITQRKLEIFKKFGGDNDHLQRVGTPQDKADISNIDWTLIHSLLQDLELREKNLVSGSFSKNLDIQLKENLDNETTLYELKKILSGWQFK